MAFVVTEGDPDLDRLALVGARQRVAGVGGALDVGAPADPLEYPLLFSLGAGSATVTCTDVKQLVGEVRMPTKRHSAEHNTCEQLTLLLALRSLCYLRVRLLLAALCKLRLVGTSPKEPPHRRVWARRLSQGEHHAQMFRRFVQLGVYRRGALVRGASPLLEYFPQW